MKSFAFAALIFFSAGSLAAEVTEEKLLAAFVFNIMKFTHWKSVSDSSPLRVSVVGNSEVAQALKGATEGKSIGSHKVEMLSSGSLTGAEVVVLLTGDARSSLPKLKGCHCLVVTKDKGLAEAGSTINFFNRDEKLRFEVNLKAAKAEGVELDSQLLRLGEIVQQ